MNNAINITKDIERLLAARRLTPAFAMLENSVAADPSLWEIKAEITSLRESYAFMTRYALEGMPDPGRAELYDDLVASIRTLGDMSLIHNTEPT
ncbi:MAG: hypothetical protein K2I35_09315, partial [Duncaniella sp.]|nr:hypothetical protein [Duncaniella sp.]